MPVKDDPLQISPYTSTVPLVQLPVQDMYPGQPQPSPNVWGGKGTSGLAIGDALLKGFLQGHALKEQKKNAQAQATIAAADAGAQAAYDTYQQKLTQAGGDVNNADAKAAYDAYVGAFNQSKAAKAQFVLPDEKKGKSKAKTDTDPVRSPDDKKKGKDQKTGFGNFKDFFEANPHIVPQIALVTMQPKPQGLSAEGQQSVESLKTQRLQNEAQQTLQQNEKTYRDGYSTYSTLSEEQIKALPPEVKAKYDQWNNARAALMPMKFTGTTRLYKVPNPDGTSTKMWLHPEEAGMYPGAEPDLTTNLKPGTEAYFQTQYATQHGMDPGDIPADVSKYLHDYWQWKQQYGPNSVSTSTVDIAGNRTTTTSKQAPPPPKPPAGYAAVEEGGGIQPPPQAAKPSATQAATPQGATTTPPAKAAPATGGISKPPTATSAAKPASAKGISAPPTAAPSRKKGETVTQYTARVTATAQEKQAQGYQKAESTYRKSLESADTKYQAEMKRAGDDTNLQQLATQARDLARNMAQQQLEIDKKSVATAYDAAVRQIGGTPGDQQSSQNSQKNIRWYQGHPYTQDPQTGQWNLQTGQ